MFQILLHRSGDPYNYDPYEYNLLGIGFGTWFFGFMSDRMTANHGADALQYSILYGLGFYLLSSAICFIDAWRLKRDWYRG